MVSTATDDEKLAQYLAEKIVENKLGACVQIQAIKSIYRWQGTLEKTQEFLLSIKTVTDKLLELQDFIVKNHNYDTPEVVIVPIVGGSDKYLNWLEESLA